MCAACLTCPNMDFCKNTQCDMRTIVVFSDTLFVKKTQIFSNSIREKTLIQMKTERKKEISSSFAVIIHVEKKRKDKFRGIFTYQTGSNPVAFNQLNYCWQHLSFGQFIFFFRFFFVAFIVYILNLVWCFGYYLNISSRSSPSDRNSIKCEWMVCET